MADSVLRLENVSKAYSSPDGSTVEILKDIDLSIEMGSSVSIVGQSGCGKSTLLACAALLLSSDGGRIIYNGEDVRYLDDRALSELRRNSMGFVFQSSLLLEDFTALENVAMPLLIKGIKKRDAYRRAEEYLALMKIDDRASYKPVLLSGGERQRTAIARAIVSEPSIIFADEPTGALDEESASLVESLLLSAVKEKGLSMMLVTHNNQFAMKCDHSYLLKSGVLNEK